MTNDIALKPKRKLKKLGVFSVPYLVWNVLLIVIPSLVLLIMAFTTYDFSKGSEFRITLQNWSYVFGSSYAKTVFWPSLLRSFLISFLVTLFTFIIDNFNKKFCFELLLLITVCVCACVFVCVCVHMCAQ